MNILLKLIDNILIKYTMISKSLKRKENPMNNKKSNRYSINVKIEMEEKVKNIKLIDMIKKYIEITKLL